MKGFLFKALGDLGKWFNFKTFSLLILFNGQVLGVVRFARIYGQSYSDQAHDVQQTNDGGYIIAGNIMFSPTEHFTLLIKTDTAGNIQWVKTYGGGNLDEAMSVQQTNDGGYILAGRTRSFGAGDFDFFIVKTDNSGNLQWAKTFGGSDWDEANFVQQVSDGGYILIGYTFSFGGILIMKIDGSGNLQWAKTFGGSGGDVAHSAQQLSDGSFIVAGATSSFGAGGSDILLLKTDGSGNIQWAKTFGGDTADVAYSVQQTSDNGFIIAGYTGSFGAGATDILLIKTDGSGNLQWAKTFGGSDVDYAYSVQQTSDGGYIVVGITRSFGGVEVFVIKTDGSGNLIWSKTFGNGGFGYSIRKTNDAEYIIAGHFPPSGLYSDVFLIKTDADVGPCSIFTNVTPTITTPALSTTTPSYLPNSPSLVVQSPSIMVTSQTLRDSMLCTSSISEDQSTKGCARDFIIVGKEYITIISSGEFTVKVYDIRGNIVRKSSGKDEIKINLRQGVYFVEIGSNKGKTLQKVIIK